ncbi:hypothetical protein ACWDBD_36870 [Streptomyces sp. NPDC001118]
MSAVLEPEEGPGTAEVRRRGFWAWVRRVLKLKVLVLVAQLAYYVCRVWREL